MLGKAALLDEGSGLQLAAHDQVQNLFVGLDGEALLRDHQHGSDRAPVAGAPGTGALQTLQSPKPAR
jgi:hypothetical protein